MSNVRDNRVATSDFPLQSRPASRLRASRPESFRVRIRFVFPVCHSFPICGVTRFDPCPIDLRPLPEPDVRRRRIRLPTNTYVHEARCAATRRSSVVRHCVRRMPGSLRVLARTPSLHRGAPSGSARLRFTRLDFGLQRYYASFRLPENHLPSLLLQLLGHTRSSMIGSHSSFKNLRVSLVALMT